MTVPPICSNCSRYNNKMAIPDYILLLPPTANSSHITKTRDSPPHSTWLCLDLIMQLAADCRFIFSIDHCDVRRHAVVDSELQSIGGLQSCCCCMIKQHWTLWICLVEALDGAVKWWSNKDDNIVLVRPGASHVLVWLIQYWYAVL